MCHDACYAKLLGFMMSISRIGSSLLPIITSIASNRHDLSTGFLVGFKGSRFVIASEHATISGKQYSCVLPSLSMAATAVKEPRNWITLDVAKFIPNRHQVILRFRETATEKIICSSRTQIDTTSITKCASAKQGDDVCSLGFWSKHPELPAALRKGYVSAEGSGDCLVSIKILHGNSGAPIWRVADGRIIGTAQKNLFDSIVLSRPIDIITEIDSYSDLIAVTALDEAVTWIESQI